MDATQGQIVNLWHYIYENELAIHEDGRWRLTRAGTARVDGQLKGK